MRAVQQAAALRDALEPRFKFDETGNVVPDVRAEAAIIYDPESGKVLWESNSTSRRSIASITKVMTATVFLENSPDLTREVVVVPPELRLVDAWEIMKRRKIHHLPVVRGGRLLGMLSDRDVFLRARPGP